LRKALEQSSTMLILATDYIDSFCKNGSGDKPLILNWLHDEIKNLPESRQASEKLLNMYLEEKQESITLRKALEQAIETLTLATDYIDSFCKKVSKSLILNWLRNEIKELSESTQAKVSSLDYEILAQPAQLAVQQPIPAVELLLLRDYRRVQLKIGREPSFRDIDKYGKYHSSTYAKKYGSFNSFKEIIGSPLNSKIIERTGVQLDMNRIAALKEESKNVTDMLVAIFEQDAATEILANPPIPDNELEVGENLWGLDMPHSDFIKSLCNRAQWSRSELEEIAVDCGIIMLDGALEQINEAAFDTFDAAFTEGDDPIDINQDILKELMK